MVTIGGAAGAVQPAVGFDPVAYARGRLSETGAHIVLDAKEDRFPRTLPGVRRLAELALWIARWRRSRNPLYRGWFGPLVRGDGVVRQSYTSCTCGRCEQPFEVRHVGQGMQYFAEGAPAESYELTVRKFVGCGRCAYCLWRKRAELVEKTCAEVDRALEKGDRVWWGTITFKPTRYAEAVAAATASFEDPDEGSKQSRRARYLRARLPEGEAPSWASLSQDERDLLLREQVYGDVQLFLMRARSMEWSDDLYRLQGRATPCEFRYVCVAEIAAAGSREETLRRKGIDPDSLGPGIRMIHFHVILVCQDGEIITKRTLDNGWRQYGGGVTKFELLGENLKRRRVEYLCEYAAKGPLSRAFVSANWGLCVSRGSGEATVKAAEAARRLEYQAVRMDAAYLEAVRFDAEQRAQRDAQRTAYHDSLVVAGELEESERARWRAVAQRLVDHDEDTLDEPFEVSKAVVEAPDPPVVDDPEDWKAAVRFALEQSYVRPAKEVVRAFVSERRRRRRRSRRVAAEEKRFAGGGRPRKTARKEQSHPEVSVRAPKQRLIVDGEDR